MKFKKHIHFIGIGGTAMASLAVAFKRAGFKVTGSEPHQIFNPIKSYLQKNKIKYYFPFNGKKMNNPDDIVIGNAHVSDLNPEIIYARENNMEIQHFPQLVKKYLIKKNSVVVAGTYAKTSITAMLAYLFDQVEKNPSYLLGGIPLNFNHGARINTPKGANWSVVEGDEYPSASPWDYSSKFEFYSPKYLILSSAEWDHMDIFKTKKSYVDRFKKLVASMPKDGLIVAKLNGENLSKVLERAKCKIAYYTFDNKEIKKYRNKEIYSIDTSQIKNNKIKFALYKNNKKLDDFETQLLGDFNLENWSGALALAQELKLPTAKTKNAVKNFKGVKRRLEIRSNKNNITIIDDFAHSPSKAKGAVTALKKHFPKSRIFVIFQPNRGGRSVKCIKNYKNVFDGVHQVIIPSMTIYKKKPGVKEVTDPELTTHLKKLKAPAIYIPDDKKIISHLKKSARPNDVIIFMGSRDFDTMIRRLSS